ncbi:MAG: hypothetical protein K9M54_04425 [Kiritimatiellales bacterium]|nr:hypothetical protein [Kiritimatiellales bacterium]
MSAKKLVVVAHGIGNAEPDFHKAWEAILNTNHDPDKFEVQGLYWEDVLQKVESKYPIINSNFAEAVEQFGFEKIRDLLDDDTYKMVSDYAMDVLVYCALDDMREYIQTQCIEKLHQLCNGRQSETILIGHSLGAAMLPHISWKQCIATGSMPYLGMILLASPLGIVSPRPSMVGDLLKILGKINGGDRISTLTSFATAWGEIDDGRLHFLINENDMVCSDVKFEVGGETIDLIPIRQGFNSEEIIALELGSTGSIHKFKQGNKTFSEIMNNHAESLYLKRPEFKTVFNQLLDVEVPR